MPYSKISSLNMENDYFMNAEFSSQLYFQPSLSALQDQNHFQNPKVDKPMQHHSPFESALSTMVSSPSAAHTCATDSFAIRELIGKLGTICSSSEISPELLQGSTYINGENNSPNTSCYNTPMDSPPQLHLPVINHFMQENVPNLGNPMAMNSALPELSADPGFATRAAKFSCFGSRSLNGRTSQVGPSIAGFQCRSNNRTGNGKLPRVSNSPSLKEAESPKTMSMHVNRSYVQAQRKMRSVNASAANSNEESCIPAQNPSGENGSTTPKELNSRKRKSISRGKPNETALSQPVNAIKGAEGSKNLDVKRSKATGDGGNDNGKSVKTQEDQNQKTPEPPKDYIHVRARRGQATDSHSLAERVRREKIGERMKLLQDLVPGCNKVTGKALMLDEIINYVQSLQRQVEFLSMKLATVNPGLDINMDRVLPKDKFQPNGAFLSQNFPVNSSASAYYGHQVQQMPQMHKLVEPLDATFGEALPQFPAFYEADLLQSLVLMSYSTNQTTHMKSEP